MRKLVAYELVSLDGVAQSPEEFFLDWDEAMDANLGVVIGEQDTVLLGRRSYDEWSGYWPTSTDEPFSTFINAVPKFVATSSPLDGDWNNSTAIEGEIDQFVRDLKAVPGGAIGIHASISLTQALLSAGLVDQLKLLVAPVIVGKGNRLLDGLPRVRLELESSTSSPTGYLMLDYRVRDSSE